MLDPSSPLPVAHAAGAPGRCPDGSGLAAHLLRLLASEQGQDLIEHALLAATVGLAGIGVLQALMGVMGTSYVNWNTQIYNLWETPPPTP